MLDIFEREGENVQWLPFVALRSHDQASSFSRRTKLVINSVMSFISFRSLCNRGNSLVSASSPLITHHYLLRRLECQGRQERERRGVKLSLTQSKTSRTTRRTDWWIHICICSSRLLILTHLDGMNRRKNDIDEEDLLTHSKRSFTDHVVDYMKKTNHCLIPCPTEYEVPVSKLSRKKPLESQGKRGKTFLFVAGKISSSSSRFNLYRLFRCHRWTHEAIDLNIAR